MQPALGVQADEWAMKMKTKRGACNVSLPHLAKPELAKKPQCLGTSSCELLHLLERQHNDNFFALLNEYLPQWRSRRSELNAAPLAHARWVTSCDEVDWSRGQMDRGRFNKFTRIFGVKDRVGTIWIETYGNWFFNDVIRKSRPGLAVWNQLEGKNAVRRGKPTSRASHTSDGICWQH
jgi:hypothetical protein